MYTYIYLQICNGNFKNIVRNKAVMNELETIMVNTLNINIMILDKLLSLEIHICDP